MTYIAPLIHAISVPLIFLNLKINFKTIIAILILSLILFGHFLDRIIAYSGLESENVGSSIFLLLALAIAIIKYLRLVKLNQIEN